MDTVAIVGVGLIGGSFALAIREAGFAGTIVGVSSERTIARALELGVIDEGLGLEAAVRRADLIYLAQPILSIIETLERIGSWVRPEALITDAGSTKAQILESARRHIKTGTFLGGHPMAGKESRGVDVAEASLFRGRPYALTPFKNKDLQHPVALQLQTWIQTAGAHTLILDAEEHDRLAAYVSHVPQLLSTALAVTLSKQKDSATMAGRAAVELTRLALSPYDIWRDILVTNAGNIREAIRYMIAKLQYLNENLTERALAEEFSDAGAFAEILRKQ